ncbi:MAG: translation initiation factor IF-3 [Acidimicrobiales bacterium]|nr:translation initiation factor IF-3 [Acidimicrobiales bacterium]
MADQNREPRINDRIRAREVRVISPEGSQLGIKPLPDALALARNLELDLVEIAPDARPPVVKIMDWGKEKYKNAQRAKESKKKSTRVVVKEMKYRPKISSGDFETKTRKVEKFLHDGHKVKITIMFRGREVTHPELGRNILDAIAERTEDYAKIEARPRLESRNMTMVLGPDAKKASSKDKKKKDEERDATAQALDRPAPPTPEEVEAVKARRLAAEESETHNG